MDPATALPTCEWYFTSQTSSNSAPICAKSDYAQCVPAKRDCSWFRNSMYSSPCCSGFGWVPSGWVWWTLLPWSWHAHVQLRAEIDEVVFRCSCICHYYSDTTHSFVKQTVFYARFSGHIFPRKTLLWFVFELSKNFVKKYGKFPHAQGKFFFRKGGRRRSHLVFNCTMLAWNRWNLCFRPGFTFAFALPGPYVW